MAQVRAIGLCLLLWTATAGAESVAIEVTPQAVLRLELTAATQSASQSLGAALAKSLGCVLTDTGAQVRGSEWVYRANCSGVFHRRGQVVEGPLKFAAFRQALIKASVDEIQVDVGAPDAPYWRGGFPKSWERSCRNGVVHQTSLADPRELPAKAFRLAVGYRTPELALIFAPAPLMLLLAVGLVVWLNRKAAKAGQMDPRALWFSYVRGVAWGLTGIYLLSSALWAAIAGVFGGEGDVWALFSEWNGGRILTGKLLAGLFCLVPPLFAALLCMCRAPKSLAGMRDPQHRFADAMKMFLLPGLALIVPAAWTISAFGALGGGQWIHVFSRIWAAAAFGFLLRYVMRAGRAERAAVLEPGEVSDRLRALAVRCGTTLNDITVIPMRAPLIAEPVEVGPSRVALSEYALEMLEPAEIEAEVARRWALPLRRVPDLRDVLVFLVALLAGMALSLLALLLLSIPLGALQLLLHIHGAAVSARLSLAFAVMFGAMMGRLIQGWLVRRGDRRAAVLVGSAEVVRSAAKKMAAMVVAPREWSKAAGVPVTAVMGKPAGLPRMPRIFSTSWRNMVSSVEAYGIMFTLSVPPLLVALAVRSGAIPAAARWPAYLAVMMLALLLRHTISKMIDCWAYRRLRGKMAAAMHVVQDQDVMFVGLSPEPRPLVYDGNWDWDVGFLTLSAERLDYQGEQARFTLRREQVTEIRVAKGAPHWSDPHWVYLSWRDGESGRTGVFPLILPAVRSPWGLARQVRDLHRALLSWKSGTRGKAAAPAAELGLPVFAAGSGAPPPNQLPHKVLMVAIGALGLSYLAHFPIGGEATLYFGLVWFGNVLLDVFGHRLAASPETATA